MNLDIRIICRVGKNVKWFQKLDDLGHYTIYVESQGGCAYRLLKFSMDSGKQEFYVISKGLGKHPVLDQLPLEGGLYIVLLKERMQIINMKDKFYQSLLLD